MNAPEAVTGPSRVLLHIGPPKTGTTYVQGVLWANKAGLGDDGVLVPGRGSAAHFSASGNLRGRTKRRGAGSRRLAGQWDRLAAEVRDWPGTSVISCEWLAFCTPAQVQRALSSFGATEVHVVVTLRDLGRVVPAVWQEQVKNGKDFTLSEFLQILANPAPGSYGELFWSVQDTRQLLSRWGRGLPPERTHVVTVPRSGAAPDELWHRFSSLFTTQSSTHDTSGVRANPGLDPASAELLRRVNAELGGRMRKAAHSPLVKQLLHGELTKEQSTARIRLPADAVEPIAATGAAVTEWLRSSGHEVVGDLADLRVGAMPADTTLPEHSAEGEVSRAAVRSTAALLLTMQSDGAHRRKVWRSGDEATDPQPGSDGPQPGAGSTPGDVARRARRAAGAVRRRVRRG